MRGSRRRIVPVVVALACATAALVGPPAGVARADAATDPIRILIVGDSVTQGSAGDFTWRYRLWRHLAAQGAHVDFVGPRTDLFDNVRQVQGSIAYADPAFDRDHAARWGAWIGLPEIPIGTLVETYAPDVVIEMLGYNDLAWGGLPPADVAADVSQFVSDARAADPGVKFVLAHQVQTWAPNVTAFNGLLDSVASSLTDPGSPVVVSRPDVGFAHVTHTWDPAHPNAEGELLIAAAQADALAALGIGATYPRPLPTLPLGPRTPAALAATSRDRAVALIWAGPPGADHEFVWIRDVTPGAGWGWRRTPSPLPGSRWTYRDLVNGHTYDFRLEAVKGYHSARDVRSNVVRVVPRADPPILTRARVGRDGRVSLAWGGPRGKKYLVARSTNAKWKVVALTTASSIVLPPDVPGTTRRYRVSSSTGGVRSRPSSSVRRTIPLPRPVRGLRATSPAPDRVRVRWDAVPEARSYRVLAAGSPSCGARTHEFRPRLRTTGRRVVLRTTARALWVRTYSMRLGVSSRLVASSTDCTRVR